MNVWSLMIVLRRQRARIFLGATIVYAQKDMRETGKITEQDAVQNPVPNQRKISC